VAVRTGSSTLNFLLGDHLGSTSLTTDSSGVRSAEIRYYPWGTERYTYSTTPTTFRFTGQRLENSIGLYYYGARWSARRTLATGGLAVGNSSAYGHHPGDQHAGYLAHPPVRPLTGFQAAARSSYF
jgi:hypothetical protein